ncbi:MAG: hypothetical protein PHQ14_09720, partial [Chromatiales bacterium]|nr:hypothetical protein [Chromatiales bacterium]
MKTLLRTLTLCTVLVSGPALADTVADEARQMALMGAPDLALGLLDRQPPDSAADPERWVRRERARIEILQADGRWERVVQRAESLPDGLPLAFTAWVRDEQLSAYQQLAQGAKMRQLLRAMLWTAPEAADPETFRRWRRLVIESYLVEDRLEDARAALVHYRRDYGDEAPDVAKLQARVQLMLNASGAIPDVLVGMDDHEARALVLLARLRSGVMEPAQVAQAVERETARGGLAPQDQARYGYVAAEAARQRQDRAAYAHFIERALVHQRYLQHDHVFRLDGERLWGAYLALGHALGNEAQLLVGQDEIWMAAAEGALIDDDPRTARGYLAVLAIEGQSDAVREEAHRRLTRLVLAQDQGPEILYWLYLRSERFQDADRLPLPVRHVLADHLLARGE